jgi:hypothetical protein
MPPCASAASEQKPYLIDDFDGPTALQGWRAASGTLTLGPGHHDHGAVLAYRLPCDRDTGCGASASALWTPPASLPKIKNPSISLWVRFSPEADVSLVAKDTGGHTLRFPIPPATIEHPKAGDWQYVVVPLSAGGIKGRLAEAGIQVQARARVAVQGSVSFDDVRLREYSETFYVGSAVQVSPSAPDSSQLAARLGVNIHLLRDDPALDLARSAGFRFVRMDMLWTDVERGGRYRFFQYDALLRSLDARGMGVLWILDYGHPDHGGKTPRTPEDVAAFGRFAAAAAAHFKGRNVRYEVWNEPNTGQFWTPFPNPLEYAALLREAVAAIRKADPSAKVSSGGVSRMDLLYLSRAVPPGVAANLTAVGIHPYPESGPEAIAPQLAILREWVSRALGESIEIWDTEWGYSSANAPKEAPTNGHTEDGRRRQANLAVRELLTVWTVGFPLAVYYDLRDDGPDPANPEHNYGLLDSSGKEKPAMQAMRTLMSAVNARKFVGMVQETPAGTHAMRLDGPADTILVVWNDQPNTRRVVEYLKQDLTSATDAMGRPLKLKDKLDLPESAGPIYLHCRKTGTGFAIPAQFAGIALPVPALPRRYARPPFHFNGTVPDFPQPDSQ